MNPVVTTNSNILCLNLHSEVLVSIMYLVFFMYSKKGNMECYYKET